MISAFSDVEYRIEGGCLSGRGQHGCGAAFQFADLFCDEVVGGVLQTAVEIAAGFKIEQLSHILGGCVAESRALGDGELYRFAVTGDITSLDAQCVDVVVHLLLFFLSQKNAGPLRHRGDYGPFLFQQYRSSHHLSAHASHEHIHHHYEDAVLRDH